MNGKTIRLVVITTHPIQYAAPWYRSLAGRENLDLRVLFLRRLSPEQQGLGFGTAFTWDIPLCDGYCNMALEIRNRVTSLPILLWRISRQMKSMKPNAVLVTGWNEKGLVMAILCLRLLGIPTVVRGDSNDLTSRGWLRGIVLSSLLRCVSAATEVGIANRRFYLDVGLPATRVFPGAHFVDNEFFLKMARSHVGYRMEARSDVGFIEGDFVFSFCGKHVPFKRPMMLIEAAAMLRAKGLPVKLLFAGSGELTSELKQSASTLGVPAVFTGFLNQTELWKAYVPADAFVLPSTNHETWGLVTNEAMLFELPVIVSDQVGCGPDLVVEGETGYVFSGEAAGLAEAMERLMAQSHARVSEMGRLARQHVLDHYSMANATAGLLAALEAIAVEGARS